MTNRPTETEHVGPEADPAGEAPYEPTLPPAGPPPQPHARQSLRASSFMPGAARSGGHPLSRRSSHAQPFADASAWSVSARPLTTAAPTGARGQPRSPPATDEASSAQRRRASRRRLLIALARLAAPAHDAAHREGSTAALEVPRVRADLRVGDPRSCRRRRHCGLCRARRRRRHGCDLDPHGPMRVDGSTVYKSCARPGWRCVRAWSSELMACKSTAAASSAARGRRSPASQPGTIGLIRCWTQ